MTAWKFLAAGAVSPFTGFRWPLEAETGIPADEWVDAPAAAPEDRWIHACRIADLPWWLGPAELWEVQLADPVATRRQQIASPRARLVRQVKAWDAFAAVELARACRARAVELAARAPPGVELAALVDGFVTTTERFAEHAPVNAHATRLLAELLGGPEAREAERAWQARWLAERLQLG